VRLQVDDGFSHDRLNTRDPIDVPVTLMSAGPGSFLLNPFPHFVFHLLAFLSSYRPCPSGVRLQGSGRLDGDFIDGRLNTSSAEKPANPLGLYHRKETRMLIARLCSWCGRSLPPKECKDPCSGKLTHPVTHTICAECFEKAMDDILSASAKPIEPNK
jgi:hypothetical protein